MKSEAEVLSEVRLEGAKKNIHLWRNNCGAVYDPVKRMRVRFGLANDSKKINTDLKSADLIGIKPVLITHDMVGKTIGQFISREIKKSNWQYTGTNEEIAQSAWVDLINANGGDAAIVNSTGTL